MTRRGKGRGSPHSPEAHHPYGRALGLPRGTPTRPCGGPRGATGTCAPQSSLYCTYMRTHKPSDGEGEGRGRRASRNATCESSARQSSGRIKTASSVCLSVRARTSVRWATCASPCIGVFVLFRDVSLIHVHISQITTPTEFRKSDKHSLGVKDLLTCMNREQRQMAGRRQRDSLIVDGHLSLLPCGECTGGSGAGEGRETRRGRSRGRGGENAV